jgi:hypothetical protein
MGSAPRSDEVIPITQARRDAFRALQSLKWTDPQIAAAISVHVRTLKKWRAEERARVAQVRDNCLAIDNYLDRA